MMGLLPSMREITEMMSQGETSKQIKLVNGSPLHGQMKPMLSGMAGMGAGNRTQQVQDLQTEMMDPSQMRRRPKRRALARGFLRPRKSR